MSTLTDATVAEALQALNATVRGESGIGRVSEWHQALEVYDPMREDVDYHWNQVIHFLPLASTETAEGWQRAERAEAEQTAGLEKRSVDYRSSEQGDKRQATPLSIVHVSHDRMGQTSADVRNTATHHTPTTLEHSLLSSPAPPPPAPPSAFPLPLLLTGPS